jgi:hypothetical protein
VEQAVKYWEHFGRPQGMARFNPPFHHFIRSLSPTFYASVGSMTGKRQQKDNLVISLLQVRSDLHFPAALPCVCVDLHHLIPSEKTKTILKM